MTARCDYCHTPIERPRPGQRFCSDPGSTCRQNWHRENHLPGTIAGLRQLKNGRWSVIVQFPEQPEVKIGASVRFETTPSPRLDASSEDNGGQDDNYLDIPSFLRKQAD